MKKILIMMSLALVVSLFSQMPKAQAFTDKDCGDFSSKQAVMDFWYNNGYSASYDPHRLDRDNDGKPCEVTAGEYNDYLKSKTTATTTSSYGWKQINGKWYYYNSSGKKATGWLYTGGKWYYLDSYGAMKTGWVKVGTKWYYLASNGVMQTGWVYSGSKWYYLNSDGTMATGWKKVSGTWYYLEASGAMKSGWLSYDGKWYYLKASGAMQTSWAKVSGKWYFFDASGVMKTGWVKSDADWYYLNSNGTLKTGWLSYGGKWYFLDAVDGFMWTGWLYVDEKLYYFYDSGVMAANTNIDGTELGPDGAAIEGQGFFDEDLKTIISDLIAAHNSTNDIYIEAEYDEYDDSISFYGDGYYLGYAENGFAYADTQFSDFITNVALAIGAPATPEEMEALVNEAYEYGEADNGLISVFNDGTTLDFFWGEDY